MASNTILSILAALEMAANAQGVPVSLVVAIAQQESSLRPYVERFEPHVYERVEPRPNYSRRFLATSHGVMQPMGYWFAKYNIPPHLAKDIKTNIELGVTIIANHYRSCSEKHDDEISINHCTSRKYNGSKEYADDIIERLYSN